MTSNTKWMFFDFETLGTNTSTAPVVSVATLVIEPARFLSKKHPFTFNELLQNSFFYKFNIQEQINLGRIIEKRVLDWWMTLPKEVRKQQLNPSSSDVSIRQLPTIFKEANLCEFIFTRGNTFDPPILTSLCNTISVNDILSYRKIRDVRSFLLGLVWPQEFNDTFFPPTVSFNEFNHHDPRHDVSLDVMRIQYILRITNGLEDLNND